MLNKYNLSHELATKDKFPPLNGILVTDKATVVTNKYCLLEVQKPDADPEEFPELENITREAEAVHVMPAKSADTIRKALKAKSNLKLPILDNAMKVKGGYCIAKDVTAPVIVSYREESAEHYPKYETLFPTTEAKAVVNMDPELLKNLLSALTEAKDQRITIEFRSQTEPLVISGSFTTGQQFRALIMPRTK